MSLLSLVLFLSFFSSSAWGSRTLPPKHEVRAVWIATAASLDWPKSLNKNEQQSSLRRIIQNLRNARFNTIFFQVRAHGDAYYTSSYEPWAENLTGTLGKDPGWDPIAFLLEEAHASGMEVHAWFNLYKVGGPSLPAESNPQHVARSHPEWVMKYDGEFWLDPGIPEVNRYLLRVALDLVRQYDIDGIQFDFARYPAPDFKDERTYLANHRGLQLHDWRQSNINRFIQASYDSTTAIKPMLKVGATPLGNFDGTSGDSKPEGYYNVYQDALGWLENGSLDYLVPQIYWNIGSSSGDPDFSLLTRKWQEHSAGRHMYAGIGSYKPEILAELAAQVDSTRAHGCQGHSFFRYGTMGDFSSLKDRYRTLAIVPPMPWKDSTSPPSPAHLTVTELASSVYHLEWTYPAPTGPNESPVYFNIYRSIHANIDFSNPVSLIAVFPSKQTFYIDSVETLESARYYYAVTALNRGNNESAPSPVTAASPKELLALRTLLCGTLSLAATVNNSPDSLVLIAYRLPFRMRMSLQAHTERTEIVQLESGIQDEGTHLLSLPLQRFIPGEYLLRLETPEGIVEHKLYVK